MSSWWPVTFERVLSSFVSDLAPVIQKGDSSIQWINLNPLDNAIGFRSTYPMESDLSSAIQLLNSRDQLRNLLKKGLAPLHTKLENMLTTTIKKLQFFLSDKYENLLSQIQQSNDKLTQRKIELSKVISQVNKNIKKNKKKKKNGLKHLFQTIMYAGSSFCLEGR